MTPPVDAAPFAVVLGIAQDGGHPQVGCTKSCCFPEKGRHLPSSVGLVDPSTGSRWMIDATPAFPEQLARLDAVAPRTSGSPLDGILLTHGHIGHYTGLMYLGREVMGTHLLPVWAMPRMAAFLRDNGPWSLLVKLQNIALQPVEALQEIHLGASLVATPILVPHRDEFTETVAWRIQGPHHAMLWLPDIDGWDRWDRDLPSVLATVDVAYLDGTFFADGELQRDMSDIPHPRIRDTLARIASLPPETRAKVRFVHLNHTNPALDPASPQSAEVTAAGSRVAAEGERFDL